MSFNGVLNVDFLKANLTFLGASNAYVDHSHAYKHFFCAAFCIPRRLEPSKCVHFVFFVN